MSEPSTPDPLTPHPSTPEPTPPPLSPEPTPQRPGQEPSSGGSTPPGPADSASSGPSGPTRLGLLIVIALVVFVVDQVTKVIAVAQLDPAEPVRILGGAVYLSLTRNPGAAFGMGEEITIVFPFIYLIVIGVILYVARRIRSIGWTIALGLVLSGALGNLMDRLFRSPGPLRGAVVDFISVFAPYGQKFAIFNVADSAISVGGVLALLLALLGHEMDGTRHRATTARRADQRP